MDHSGRIHDAPSAASTARVIDLNALVLDAESGLRRRVGENIEIQLSLRAVPSWIRAETNQIDQVVRHLAENAHNAMPDGGVLYIETSTLAVEDDFASMCLSVPRGIYVMLTVSDTGTGMAPEVAALSAVHAIVMQAGGAITVHSSPGVGTAFKVLFRSIQALDAAHTESALTGRCGSETILLIEDDGEVREYIRSILEEHGYSVLDATNGPDAIQLAKRALRPIHLLLTDTVLPGMSGNEAAREIAAILPGIHVLRMSGYTDAATRRAEAHFVEKPFTTDALLERVRAALDRF